MFMTAAKPSDRQIKYAEILGIQVRKGISRDELTAQMDAVIGRSFKTGKFVKQVDPSVYDRKPTTWPLTLIQVANWLVFIAALFTCLIQVAGTGNLPEAGYYPVAVLGCSFVFEQVMKSLKKWIRG